MLESLNRRIAHISLKNLNIYKVKKPLESLPYPLIIYRSKRNKRVKLTIKPNLTIRLTAPLSHSQESCLLFLQKHRAWIEHHMQHFREKEKTAHALLENHPDCIMLFGSWVPLADLPDKNLKKHLKSLLVTYLEERLAFWSNNMGLAYQGFSVRQSKNRLGSCAHGGRLSFSLQLLFFPKEVIDYILVHELSHIPHPNHSKLFWQHVSHYCPSYPQAKVYLRQHYTLHSLLREKLALYM